MFATKNNLAEGIRGKSEALLQKLLTNGIDLQLQTKQAHWNVRGPRFLLLHELFDQVYGEVAKGVDLIAERIVQLGGNAEGTVQFVNKNTGLQRFPLANSNESQLLLALCESLAEFGRQVRSGIDTAQDGKDAVTADLLTEVTRGLDKNLWMVESHVTERDRVSAKEADRSSQFDQFSETEGWRGERSELKDKAY